MPDLYEDVFKYLEKSSSFRISTKGLEDLVGQVCAFTGVDKSTSEIIIKSFFREIVNALMRQENVVLYGVGTFYPMYKTIKGSKSITYPRFSAHKKLIKTLEVQDGSEIRE